MTFVSKACLATLCLTLSAPVFAATPSVDTSLDGLLVSDQGASQESKAVMVARGKKRAKKGGKSTREKHITREAVVKGKDARNIDFEAVDISGQRKTPMGTLINQNKANKNYDFVKIRLRWHPEMVQSAASLDSGK